MTGRRNAIGFVLNERRRELLRGGPPGAIVSGTTVAQVKDTSLSLAGRVSAVVLGVEIDDGLWYRLVLRGGLGVARIVVTGTKRMLFDFDLSIDLGMGLDDSLLLLTVWVASVRAGTILGWVGSRSIPL